MGKNLEGRMAEVMAEAVDDTDLDYEDGAQSEEGEEIADDATDQEGDEEALDESDEQSDEEVADAEDEEPAGEPEDGEEEEFVWDGKLDSVPENLRPYVNHIQEVSRKGWDVWSSTKANEWNRERLELNRRITELETSQRKAQMESNAPKEPVRRLT